MADEEKTSESGIWLDDATGQVVYKAPHTGTQLVRPGGRITDAAQARIDGVEKPVADRDLTIKSESVSTAKAKRAL